MILVVSETSETEKVYPSISTLTPKPCSMRESAVTRALIACILTFVRWQKTSGVWRKTLTECILTFVGWCIYSQCTMSHTYDTCYRNIIMPGIVHISDAPDIAGRWLGGTVGETTPTVPTIDREYSGSAWSQTPIYCWYIGRQGEQGTPLQLSA